MLATPAATSAYARRHADLPGHYRILDGLTVSSLGLGTYLGRDTEADDALYRDAALVCLQSGVNLIDTAINYRSQRSERALGEALRRLPRLSLSREQVVICTKAGYLPFDGTVPRDSQGYLRRTFLDSGRVPPGQLAAGCHCMHPAYLRDQLGRSLHNLGLSGVDVFYLHNPETQLEEVGRTEFDRRLMEAFALLEELCGQGLIGRSGMATWSGFRQEPSARTYLSLARVLELARQVAGQGHHFKVVQLPLSLAMDEALFRKNQRVDDADLTLLEAAGRLGIAVICSGPLLQGKVLSRPLPERLRRPFAGLTRDSQRALQFVRSAPGVTAVLCGMKMPAHLEENLALLQVPPLSAEAFSAAF
jgi:aryl-alcohol dehydrogenase-like predicted oxidoreductase